MFLRIVSSSILRRWPRRFLALTAIWIGIALFASLLSVGLDAGDAMNREMTAFGANIRVEPLESAVATGLAGEGREAASRDLEESDLGRIGEIFWRHNILGVVPRFRGEARVDGSPVEVLGVGVDAARGLHAHWRVVGEWPASGQALAGERLALRLGLARGDSLELRAARTLPVEIVGFLSTGGSEDEALVVPLATAQELFDRPGRVTDAEVSALTTPENGLARRYRVDPASLTPEEYERWACTPYPASVASQIQEAVPGSSARVVRRVAETQGALLERIDGLLYLLGALGLSACALSVLGILSPAVLARSREAALFEALGAHRNRVIGLFLAEAAALGAAGGILGGLTGSLVGGWLVETVFEIDAAAKPVVLVLAPLAGILLSAFASWFPVSRVLDRNPATMLRG